jgi:undecaprenyl-diphosphatase
MNHYSILLNGFIVLVSFLDDFTFMGLFFPGTVILGLVGFFASRWSSNFHALFVCALLGALMGDSVSFLWGRLSEKDIVRKRFLVVRSLYQKNRLSFENNRKKALLLSRFMVPKGIFISFIAGFKKMPPVLFLLWDFIGTFLWAGSSLYGGVMIGRVWQIVEVWGTSIWFWIGGFCLLFFLFHMVKKFMLLYGEYILRFLKDIRIAAANAIRKNPEIEQFVENHPHLLSFIQRRFDRRVFSGLPLTVLSISFFYIVILLLGIIEDVVTSEPVFAADIRIAHFVTLLRHPFLSRIFFWITLLGNAFIVISLAFTLSLIAWFWGKNNFILPLWLTLAGSQLFTTLGKMAFHRPRPDVAMYLEHSFSFPSGHASSAVALYGFVAYALIRITHEWKKKVDIFSGALLVVLAIGFSRLYFGVHYASDVYGGYLIGLMWLIISVSFLEQISAGSQKLKKHFSKHAKRYSCLSGLFFIVFYVLMGFFYYPSKITILKTPLQAPKVMHFEEAPFFTSDSFPCWSETITGGRQEPISFILYVEDPQHLITIFRDAGWFVADKVNFISLYRVAWSALSNSEYDTAPMTPSFWNEDVNDLGFQKPTEKRSVRRRHHARFWNTGYVSKEGNFLFVGTASFDSGIKWGITHHIEPNIDSEREYLFQNLQDYGHVSQFKKIQLVDPVLGKNFIGDPFFSDGKAYIVYLSP